MIHQGFQKEIELHVLEPLTGYLLNDLALLIWEYAEKIPYDVWDRIPISLDKGYIDIYDNHIEITEHVKLFDNECISWGLPRANDWLKREWAWVDFDLKVKLVWNRLVIQWYADGKEYTTHFTNPIKVISRNNQLFIAHEQGIQIWHFDETPQLYGTIPCIELYDVVMLNNDSLLVVCKDPHAYRVRVLEK